MFVPQKTPTFALLYRRPSHVEDHDFVCCSGHDDCVIWLQQVAMFLVWYAQQFMRCVRYLDQLLLGRPHRPSIDDDPHDDRGSTRPRRCFEHRPVESDQFPSAELPVHREARAILITGFEMDFFLPGTEQASRARRSITMENQRGSLRRAGPGRVGRSANRFRPNLPSNDADCELSAGGRGARRPPQTRRTLDPFHRVWPSRRPHRCNSG